MSTLTYLAAWRPISARIHGLERAAAVHAGFLAASTASPYGADKELQHHCEGIKQSIEEFQKAFGSFLPTPANEAIERFRKNGGKQISENSNGDARLVRTIIVKLVAFEAELSFTLSSPLEQLRSTTELAFTHLQRLIVADEDYRKKWVTAYNNGEVTCEKLGAVHLLWHGIWAFKADAEGGKTDLIYQEPLQADAHSGALGMVLTEWKLAKSKPEDAFAYARKQAEIYTGGILAGVELSTHRYLVVVTNKAVQPPADQTNGGVTYRHINIAVAPDVPSVAAKSKVKVPAARMAASKQ